MFAVASQLPDGSTIGSTPGVRHHKAGGTLVLRDGLLLVLPQR